MEKVVLNLAVFWNKLVNKIALILSVKISKSSKAIYDIVKSSKIKIGSYSKEGIVVKTESQDIYLRAFGSSDPLVFRQVFIKEEYRPIIEFAKQNNILPKTIIDCGSNIGLATIKFKLSFPEAKIVCLEPDKRNFSLLEKNTSSFSNVILLNSAIWSSRKLLYLENNFRDGKEWSICVTDSDNLISQSTVEGLTISEILIKAKETHIDLLKIDIEGAEGELFDEEKSNLEFLKVTKLIAIEIHDDVVDRKKIIGILKRFGFILFDSGELTLGVNLDVG